MQNKTLTFPTITDNTLVIPEALSLPDDISPLYVLPDDFEDNTPEPTKHAAEPIKDVDDVLRVCEWLVANNRLRDNLLFTAGINLGYRCGDLLQLKWGHLLKADGTWNTKITLQEDKTNKLRTVYLNKAVLQAAYLYGQEISSQSEYGAIDRNLYLFRSNSTKDKENKPLSVYSVERMLKQVINKELGIDIKAGTHCMRKTFGYHAVMSAADRTRAVELLRKIFKHSSERITLSYIGITDDEIRGVYENLNLGLLNPAACCGIQTTAEKRMVM